MVQKWVEPTMGTRFPVGTAAVAVVAALLATVALAVEGAQSKGELVDFKIC